MGLNEATFMKKKEKRNRAAFLLTSNASKVRSFVWLRNALFSVKQVERGRRLLVETVVKNGFAK